MNNNGIVTISPLGGGDPQAFWITGVPGLDQQPQQPQAPSWNDQALAHENAVLTNHLLLQAEADLTDRYIREEAAFRASLTPQERAEYDARCAHNQKIMNHPGYIWEMTHPFLSKLIYRIFGGTPFKDQLVDAYDFSGVDANPADPHDPSTWVR